jgi:hypothetical protein
MDLPTTISLLDVRAIVPEITMISAALIVLLLDLVVKKKEAVAFVGVFGTIIALYGTYKLFGFSAPGRVRLNVRGGWICQFLQGHILSQYHTDKFYLN